VTNAADNSPNPLGVLPVSKLLLRYAVPSVVSMVAMSLYSIVDQIFISHSSAGYLGNGATTVAFPLITVMLALTLLIGNGAAAFTSLELGRGNHDKASRIVGNAFTLLLVLSFALMGVSLYFLDPILIGLGASENILPYARDYVSITMMSTPFAMISMGLSNVIRADGSPRYSMFAVLTGVVLNIALDPVFIFALDMGVKGAAVATVISQFVSTLLILYYIVFRARYIRLSKKNMPLRRGIALRTMMIGSSSFATQMAIAVSGIIINNIVRHYGALSPYGSDIPIAAVGIVMRVSSIVAGILIGISIGAQPIIGYNYGACNYARVREALFMAIKFAVIVAGVGSVFFLAVPHVLIGMFGDESAMFSSFAARFMRVSLCMFVLSGVQIPAFGYFQAIGKPLRAMLLSLSRQVFALVPLVLLFTLIWGLDGVMYAGPVADAIAAVVTALFLRHELKRGEYIGR
jgi:putative MATE family efflux protein